MNIARTRNAVTALLLCIPVPAIGVLFGMYLFPDTQTGKTVFLICKIWFFLFPAVWYLFIEKKQFSLSLQRKAGWRTGIISGLCISIVITFTYFMYGNSLVDTASFKHSINKVGLNVPHIYILCALYWITINSVLEEYAWRWFVTQKCTQFSMPYIAILLSATFFTLHHILALNIFLPPLAVIICSTGIFIGGLIWSMMYTRYHSIWPGYISHAIVDVAVFGIGAYILFM
jgi:uncharacterized protein